MTSTAEGDRVPGDGDGAQPTAAGYDLAGPLPEQVRTRVLHLAAQALGRVPAEELPPALRRVATFAPARRAKLAAGQIAGALEGDEEFRNLLARQLRL